MWEVVELIHDFFNGVLHINEFRLIFEVNTIYKIVAKLLAT